MIPYQCLQRCGTTLIAARGPQIDIFNLQDGSYLSSWNCALPPKEESEADSNGKSKAHIPEEKPEPEVVEDESGPAAKRRKLSNEESAEVDATKKDETQSKNGKGKKKNLRPQQGSSVPNVVLLVSTTDSKHVVAVTGEDKTIRVFKLSHESGVLEQLSERIMPKRPCAISITGDNSTIICGDKFGDVYSLPLIYSPQESEQETSKSQSLPEQTVELAPFVPAANQFTVHSRRNRKALENQKKHGKANEKIEPKFEHNLLLGHVSMLTDLALVSVQGRNYIITSDRDEHIRVSRGIPQAHIIEGYCLGHTEFISRICVPGSSDSSTLLISGGGGDEVFAWDFLSGTLLRKANLKTHVEEFLSTFKSQDENAEPFKVTVSGIYHIRLSDESKGLTFAVTCEGVPAIFIYSWTTEPQSSSFIQTLKLEGNPLDLISHESFIIVSIDTYFEAGSTDQVRSNPGPKALQHFKVEEDNVWGKFENQSFDIESAFAKSSVGEQVVPKEVMANLLYNLQNLRKQEKEEEE